ncbi:hypothetical protein [Sphingomonas sp. 37zxx]|uniref:hypothetical protein n=1 Tax=Sphingomonas sp. 37zxx TaxID=1550073 RepID=UPI00053BE358|nr:hypothetical protein [Sphingomonas sp. 37zxx]
MGGRQIPEQGPNDDGYDEEGYDESQRAEILEVTRDGPSDGNLLTDIAPDLGDDADDDELAMTADEVGEEDDDAETDADDQEEDELQADFDEDDLSEDDDLADADKDALEP